MSEPLVEPVPAQYFSWDYERRLAAEYVREGECNGCGDCCRAHIQLLGSPESQGQPKWYSPTADEHGVWGEVRVGSEGYLLKLVKVEEPAPPCPLLMAGNRCGVHAHKNRLCAEWPIHPDQVAAFPRCSYHFRHVRTWEIESAPAAAVLKKASDGARNSAWDSGIKLVQRRPDAPAGVVNYPDAAGAYLVA